MRHLAIIAFGLALGGAVAVPTAWAMFRAAGAIQQAVGAPLAR